MNKDIQEQIEEAKVELKIEAEPAQTEAEQNPVEAEARTSGWTSKDEWVAAGKPEHQWKPADQFVKDGSFFRKIDSLNKKIEQQQQVLQRMEEHTRKTLDSAYKKGMEDAIKERREAVQSGDTEQFDRAEYKIKQLEQEKPVLGQDPVQPANNVVTQDMLDWVKENASWFNNNDKENARMVKEADGLFLLEAQDNPTLSQKEILGIVKEKIQVLHPNKFENPNKQKAIAVTKGSISSSSNSSGIAARLSKGQRELYDSAKAMGSKLTIDDYAKQLDVSGDLRNE